MGNRRHIDTAVVIIGGGIAGMCAAIDLLRKWVTDDIVILEKSTGFGGAWRDSRFPGSCCDVWSHLYSYSFAQIPTWTHAYPAQEEMLQYLMSVARKYDLYKYVRFNTMVEKAVWNSETNEWHTTVTVTGGKDSEYGSTYSISSSFLVSAVGQSNLPNYPDIPGLHTFEGKLMHSARWDWSYQFEGKNVAVIGTGAIAAQIVPETAKVAKHLTVVQRSPAWVLPRHDSKIPAWKILILTYIPFLLQWYRASMMKIRESFFYAVTQAKSHHAAAMRIANQTLMKQQLPNRPDLWELLSPQYSPGCKRSVISDDYYPTLLRPNVSLETRPINTITPKGILFEGQLTETPLDALILATEYRSTEFLHPIEIIGTHGKPLHQIWDGIAQAHEGVSVEDVPNFGMLYGPNTNLTHNSLILVIEAQSRYISVLIREVLDAKSRGQTLVLTVKTDRLRAYNDKLQAALQATSFADPGCTSWWKTKDGLIPNNWCGTTREYQELLAKVDWSDFDVEGTAAGAFKGKQSIYIGRVKEEAMFHLGGLGTIASSAIVLASLAGGFWMQRLHFF